MIVFYWYLLASWANLKKLEEICASFKICLVLRSLSRHVQNKIKCLKLIEVAEILSLLRT